MQILFEIIFQTILGGLGALIKKLFGRPISSSGISEMWIGLSVVIAVLVIVLAATRPW
jgi:hypothetical protein